MNQDLQVWTDAWYEKKKWQEIEKKSYRQYTIMFDRAKKWKHLIPKRDQAKKDWEDAVGEVKKWQEMQTKLYFLIKKKETEPHTP